MDNTSIHKVMACRGIIQTEANRKCIIHQIKFSKTAQMRLYCNKCQCTVTTVLASTRGKELQFRKVHPKDHKRKVLVLKAQCDRAAEATSHKFLDKTYSLRKMASWLVVKIQTKKKNAARSSFRSYSLPSSWQHQLAIKNDFFSLKNFL